MEITHEVRGHNGLQLPQARITMSKLDGSYNKRMAALRRLVLKTCNPSGCLGEHRVVHALQVAKYLLCRNACCHDAYALHPIVSMCVVLMLLILMVLSVNLNNQSSAMTVEIRNVRPDRFLHTESQARALI